MLTPRTHRALDHVTVAVFVAAPFALGLGRAAAVVCYVLAALHLALTVATRFPVDATTGRPMAMTAHGALEVTVALILLMVPWVVPVFSLSAKVFLAVMGALLLVVWKLTPYALGDEAARPDDPGAGPPREPQPPPRP